jgi:hypothetical protein
MRSDWRHFIEGALKALEMAIFRPLTASLSLSKVDDYAKLALRIGDGWCSFTCEVIPQIKSVSQIALISTKEESSGGMPLLVTTHLGAQLIQRCVEQNIQFIDLAGNAYINVPGQTIFITGRKLDEDVVRAVKHISKGSSTTGISPLKIMFILLSIPQALRWTYREIADAAGVSLGSVGIVMQDLEERGLITLGRGKVKSRLLDQSGMIDEWIINYPLKLRPKLNGRRFVGENSISWKNTKLPEGQAWWGGEAAAAMMGAGVINAKERVVYVHPEARDRLMRDWVKQYRLRPAVNGEIEILDAFWNMTDDQDSPTVKSLSVPPLLAISDLLLSRNPRDKEAAQWLRTEFDRL